MTEDFPLYSILAASSAFVCVTALTLLVLDLLRSVEVDREAGLEEVKSLPLPFRVFMPLVPNVMPIAKLEVFEGQRKRCQELIFMAGYDQAVNGEQFVALRILTGVAGTGFLGLMAIVQQGRLHQAIGFLVFFLLLVTPMVWLKGVVRRRHLEMLKALPNVLDLLTLSVEAGKDFLTALRDIISRRKVDALGEELGRALQEIQLGKQRQKALKEMVERVQQPELASVVNAIVQADELGVSIGQLLRIQGDQLRNKRFSRAEKLANEAPVKILFPVIAFIFPAVIVILMAPIIMQALKTLSR